MIIMIFDLCLVLLHVVCEQQSCLICKRALRAKSDHPKASNVADMAMINCSHS